VNVCVEDGFVVAVDVIDIVVVVDVVAVVPR